MSRSPPARPIGSRRSSVCAAPPDRPAEHFSTTAELSRPCTATWPAYLPNHRPSRPDPRKERMARKPARADGDLAQLRPETPRRARVEVQFDEPTLLGAVFGQFD